MAASALLKRTTGIEWSHHTWNPMRGCEEVSPGCDHCYARVFAERWRGIEGHPYQQGFDPMLAPWKLSDPYKWRDQIGGRVFVNSMSDAFGRFVPDDYVAAIFAVMAALPGLTFTVLTKRAARLPKWFSWVAARPGGVAVALAEAARKYEVRAELLRAIEARVGSLPWPLPNVELGVSVEDRKHGLPRVKHLQNAPAALRVLSVEPLLEDLGDFDLSGIDGVLLGAESGSGARPMEDDWARRVRDLCAARPENEGGPVPFFLKQKAVGGVKISLPMLDGRQHTDLPRRREVTLAVA